MKKMKKKKKSNDKSVKSDGENEIITDPQGSYTGVCADDKFAKPIQDADDL